MTTEGSPQLSVVVPTRNEADNVRPLWEALSAALPDVEFEVCFVDDSDDATESRLTELESESGGRVRCQHRVGGDRVGGLATAVATGLRMARGRYVCVMDADLQHPPDTIPAMLAAAANGADVVVASRYIGGGSGTGLGGVLRHAVSRLSALLARTLFSEARRSSDPLAGFFLCRRELIDGIEFRPVGFKILLELLVCIPGITVVDVPLQFAPRASGESKAGMRQGFLFLRHLASLFFEVDGSARFWKFALVGASGLVIFVGLLSLLVSAVHLAPLAAFWPAFLPSVVWNSLLNRRWTFADVRRRRLGRREPIGYFARALVAGLVAFAAYAFFIHVPLGASTSALLAALTAMAVNGLTNYRSTQQPTRLWAGRATDAAVTTALASLADRVGADRAYVLPPRRTATPAGIPAGVFDRAVTLRRASIWTEAASYRPQRRTNIELNATLLLPVVADGEVVGVVVLERRDPRAFPVSALATATTALDSLIPLLAGTLDGQHD